MTINVSATAVLCVAALWVAPAQAADEQEAAKELSGMSILGNSEAPKSLVIVPWKTSEIGDGIGVANMLDERARPVDKDVFLRELGYYALRSSADAKAPTADANAVARR